MNITKMIGVVQKAESSNTSEALLGAPLHSAFIHSYEQLTGPYWLFQLPPRQTPCGVHAVFAAVRSTSFLHQPNASFIPFYF
jgi:hypothetical protein